MLKVASGNRDEVGDTQGGIYPLGLWTPAMSLSEKLGSWVTPGEGRRVGSCWTLTWIVSSLVRKLRCVKSWVLVKNGWLKQEAFTKKKSLAATL